MSRLKPVWTDVYARNVVCVLHFGRYATVEDAKDVVCRYSIGKGLPYRYGVSLNAKYRPGKSYRPATRKTGFSTVEEAKKYAMGKVIG